MCKACVAFTGRFWVALGLRDRLRRRRELREDEERSTFKGSKRRHIRRSGPPLAYLESNDPAVLEALGADAAPASPVVAKSLETLARLRQQTSEVPPVPIDHAHRPCPRCKMDAERLRLQERYITSLRKGLKRHEQDRSEALAELKALDASMLDFVAVERLRQGVNEL